MRPPLGTGAAPRGPCERRTADSERRTATVGGDPTPAHTSSLLPPTEPVNRAPDFLGHAPDLRYVELSRRTHRASRCVSTEPFCTPSARRRAQSRLRPSVVRLRTDWSVAARYNLPAPHTHTHTPTPHTHTLNSRARFWHKTHQFLVGPGARSPTVPRDMDRNARHASWTSTR